MFDRVKGSYCWDVDGNKYIDYVGSWGPAIVGAANDEVNEVLRAQLEKGTSFGAPCALEVGVQQWQSRALKQAQAEARAGAGLVHGNARHSPGLAAALQNELAKLVIARVPSVEMVRFVNSGTEACLSVVRLMRAYTGREKVRHWSESTSLTWCDFAWPGLAWNGVEFGELEAAARCGQRIQQCCSWACGSGTRWHSTGTRRSPM